MQEVKEAHQYYMLEAMRLRVGWLERDPISDTILFITLHRRLLIQCLVPVTLAPLTCAPIHSVMLGSMTDAEASLDGLIDATFMGAALDLGTMLDTNTILNGLIRTILSAATLNLGSMSHTHSALNCLIITTVMSTTFDLGTMFNTHTARLGLISAPTYRAISMSSFLTSSFTLLNLSSMTLAHTSLD